MPSIETIEKFIRAVEEEPHDKVIEKFFPNIEILDLRYAVGIYDTIKLHLDFLDFKSNNLKILDLPCTPFCESKIYTFFFL